MDLLSATEKIQSGLRAVEVCKFCDYVADLIDKDDTEVDIFVYGVHS